MTQTKAIKAPASQIIITPSLAEAIPGPQVHPEASLLAIHTPAHPILPSTKIIGPAAAPRAGSRLGQLVALLQREHGASLDDLCAATGWQVHSVRGAMAGSLKRKGYLIGSGLIDGIRHYQIEIRP